MKERMNYLLKTCTFDKNSYLVYAVVFEKTKTSLTGYAYLKITASEFLQLMSKKHRSNPRVYQFGNHKTAQLKGQISVGFPVMPEDTFQPKIEGNMNTISWKMTKNTSDMSDIYFAPIEKLQMVDIAEEKMTMVSFLNVVVN